MALSDTGAQFRGRFAEQLADGVAIVQPQQAQGAVDWRR